MQDIFRNRWHLLVAICLFLVCRALPVHAQDDAPYLPGEVVVKLVQTSDLPAVANDFQLDPIPLDQFGTRPIYRLRILDGADPQARADALAADQRVHYAEPNYLEDTPEGRQRISWAKGGSAGEYARQWAGDKISLPLAHTVTRGAGVTVAVLDTGIAASHPAFAGRLLPGYDFVNMDNDPSEEGTTETHPVYGHGTHVAGLIALAAPDAKIMPIRVLNADGKGNIWVLAEALTYAVDPDGDPTTADGATVINLSLSTPRTTALLAEIVGEITCSDDDDEEREDNGDEEEDKEQSNDDDDCLTANGRGAVVIAAAGNSASTSPEYPAAEGIAGLLAVAASTQGDTLAAYSNFGPWVQVAAPGDDIISSIPGDEYGIWSGTSMATPLVAGQAALIRAIHPDWDAAAVANHIVATAIEIPASAPPRIDASAALSAAAPAVHFLYLVIINS